MEAGGGFGGAVREVGEGSRVKQGTEDDQSALYIL